MPMTATSVHGAKSGNFTKWSSTSSTNHSTRLGRYGKAADGLKPSDFYINTQLPISTFDPNASVSSFHLTTQHSSEQTRICARHRNLP
ncbi:hypothetical protein PGTUg99_009194 [Puccinia graminis f. sp. tritici]|uniref:Uncharacterized protein n=1 Tax=Puccinia graminis f. sp. tritici TaxID=56615 RepID=A0A5B0PTF9_PUCGR|nr:hypothetical protein PGTUg99_016276 [Puccinia graminis f. sp. tritici]KAA1123213.1 hypothetical protein PGTUg99_009194 [Puccinia graminis f. sp. tritici]